jgi:hypothetical protein
VVPPEAASAAMPLLGIDRRVEVKCRGNGFRELYAWLNGADFLIVKADRLDALVVLPLKLAVDIATAADRNKSPEILAARGGIAPGVPGKLSK